LATINEQLVFNQWQSVFIYGLIRETEWQGIGFKALLDKYRVGSVEYKDNLPPGELSEQRLRYILTMMVQKDII